MTFKEIRTWKILLAVILYTGAVFFGRTATKGLQDTHIVLNSSIPCSTVPRIQQQEWEEASPVGFCFWTEAPQQTLSCRETGGMAVVTQILLGGNPGLMDAGSLTFQKGCLIDKQTAQDLFGTESVGAQILWHKSNAYPVLGILEAPRQTMILMADADNKLDRLVLSLPPEEGNVLGPQCLMRWGLSGTVLDTTLLNSLLRNLLLIFPGILITMLCRSLARGWRELHWDGILYAEQLPLLGRVLLSAVLFGGMLWFLGSRAVIPRHMVPAAWSDFSFWSRLWETERTNAIQLLFAPMTNRQLQILGNMVKSVVTNTAACLMLLWTAGRKDHENPVD